MKSFRFRILVLALSLVFIPLAATIYALARKADDAALSQATTELHAGLKVARESLNFHGQQLAVAAQILTADFGFKEAIASGDHDTIQSALNNHGSRLRADLLLAFDLDGQLLASANKSLSANALSIIADNLQHTALNSREPSYSIIDGIPYLLVSSTVRAPKPIARTILGFAISKSLTDEIAQIVGMNIAFIARDDQQHIIVTTSSKYPSIDLVRELNIGIDEDVRRLSASNEEMLVQREVLPVTNGTLLLELIEPLSKATHTYAELQGAIILIGGSTALAALLLGYWLMRAATKPIQTLTDAAARIEQGDYAAIDIDRSTTEFRQLTSAFSAMRTAVSDREQRILHQSQHDKLTGLPNYEALLATLTSRIAAKTNQDESIALILVELIQFADLNAALGHTVSDQLLCEIAKRLTNKLSHAGMVARVGSKQYMLMLPDTGTDAALLLGHDVLRLIQQPVTIDDIPITINARCGIALFPTHGTKAQELTRRADLALLQAQQSESNIACFDIVTEEKHKRRIQVLGDLQQAIEGNQLHLVYQPKMNMKDRHITGFEALVRWQHPVYGVVSPAEFIPHAERTGLIRQLTRWALQAALKQLAEWQSMGFHHAVAINLSAADIADMSLPNDILNLLKIHNVPANQLILEITESTVMRNTDTALAAIAQLRTHGIKFSIDDFGTGHSSLAQLRRLPVDELKLEGTLVADLVIEERARIIVRSMTELSHSLGMQVVAEGIESVQMLRAVAQCGCDVAQGYLIAKPM
ncbi:MAG TPA: EAL domain-containing protein, partial [Steroidobacteraceae bacterium]|nr:EAL domain-containing protein [Steroidobacteraceae bacterium]